MTTPSSRKRARVQTQSEQAPSPVSGKKRRITDTREAPDPAVHQTGSFGASASNGAPSTQSHARISRKLPPIPRGKENKLVDHSDVSPLDSGARLRSTAKYRPRISPARNTRDVYDGPVSEDEIDSLPRSSRNHDTPSERPRGVQPIRNKQTARKTEHDGRTVEMHASIRSDRNETQQVDPKDGNWSSGNPIEVVLFRRSNVASARQQENRAAIDLEGLQFMTDRQLSESKPRAKSGSFAAPNSDEAGVHTESAAQSDSSAEAENQDEQPSEAEEDEQEEIVCTVCSGPHSRKGNKIVLCDGCDVAVHQKCYGLSTIPKGDWYCRKCVQEDRKTDSNETYGEEVRSIARPGEAKPDMPNLLHHLRCMQRVLLDRCTGRRRLKYKGEEESYDKTLRLVEQTVVAGEGNSMLVIGPRGCGKTTLVESIVAEVSKQHRGDFHVVRLNGFIHTDDKLALREIWRQLGKELQVEDDLVGKTGNHADTMASLLALLSHPSEITEAEAGVTSSSVVFILDEFDLFTTHARQTLLYNLFDIAQARKAPIAVLGLTTRIDVVESLEKRVKSRFSHRYVYLSLAKNLPAYWDICRQGVSIDDEDMQQEGIDTSVEGHQEFWRWWKQKVERHCQSPGFKDELEFHFCSTKSVSAFLSTCLQPLAALSPNRLSLEKPSVDGVGLSLEAPDSKLHLLESLSDLDLCMLIAAARLDIVAHTDTVNFAMAYDEYTSLMGRQRVQSATSGLSALGGVARIWGRGVAGMAWERLITLGLLVPAGLGARASTSHGGLEAKMWKLDVALEEIPGAVRLPAVMSKWCREI